MGVHSELWAVLADISGILTAIVDGHKQSDIETLLPWNFRARWEPDTAYQTSPYFRFPIHGR